MPEAFFGGGSFGFFTAFASTGTKAFVPDFGPASGSCVGESEKVGEEKGGSASPLFLPGYSPELNLDEKLNQDVKSNSVGQRRAHNQEELVQNVRSYLYIGHRRRHLVKNYFEAKSVLYAAL